MELALTHEIRAWSWSLPIIRPKLGWICERLVAKFWEVPIGFLKVLAWQKVRARHRVWWAGLGILKVVRAWSLEPWAGV